MRHRVRGRKLGRNASHRKAMFRNMAASLIKTVRVVTTVPKAKELRPFIEKLITLGKKAIEHDERAAQFTVSADRNTPEWKAWPFSMLRDKEAVNILFNELRERFADRQGGYTRIVQLSQVRLGDGGKQALIEFVGENDRKKTKRAVPTVTDESLPVKDEEPVSEKPEDAPPEESEAVVADAPEAGDDGEKAES
ncbi:UNVERIFIED_CONTAM: hypothetical protein GTU68_033521 [Idotea baltica]|nr:hypothetical protein [Idotea baltica]